MREETAEDVNRDWPKLTDPPPAKPGTKAAMMETQGLPQGQFVRYHLKGNPARAWIMRRDQVIDEKGEFLSPAEVKRRFALPNLPTRVSDVIIPSDTKVTIRISVVIRAMDRAAT